MKRGPGWGVACNVKMPKFELDFCPDHWGGPFDPKLHEPSSYIIQHDLHKKITYPGLLLS